MRRVCVAGIEAKSDAEVIRRLARALGDAVKPTFEKAALLREKRSPTGLPYPEIAVALPHAEPEHVIEPAIAVGTLKTPVKFRQMGAPEIVLDVRLVVMPAFNAKEQAAAGLSKLIESLQDADIRRRLLEDPEIAW
jgi:PTS system galactitol-specific IIA component